MKLYLIVAKGKHQGFVIPVTVDLFLIGRDPMCQLRSKEGTASRHCAITTKDDRKAFVQDLGEGSTILNGEELPAQEEWPLHAGDRLEVGPLEFLVQFHEMQLSKKDAEEWALKCLDADATKEATDPDEVDEFAMLETAKPSTGASDAAAHILDKLQAQRGIVKGRLRLSFVEGVTIARFNDAFLVEPGELSMIKNELLANLKRHGMRVLLDFKNVWRMSSAATEMLKEVRLRMRGQHCSLALCRLRPELREMMEAMDSLQDVPYYEDKAAAVEAHW